MINIIRHINTCSDKIIERRRNKDGDFISTNRSMNEVYINPCYVISVVPYNAERCYVYVGDNLMYEIPWPAETTAREIFQ